jgi:uncharacterized membrane protein (DUF485 family)
MECLPASRWQQSRCLRPLVEHWSSMSSSNDEKVWVETQASPEFQALKRSFRRFAFPLTLAFLAWYLTYVALTAFARDFVATKIGDTNYNLAFVLGILQFASTFIIMWLYERHSSKKLDPASEEIRAKVEKELTK